MRGTAMANMGRDCISHPDHGASICIGKKGREWCPHRDHDGLKDKPQTPSFLDAQTAPDAAPAHVA